MYQDTAAGLIGGVVVTRKGEALPNGKPMQPDNELFAMYSVFDESISPYFEDNIRLFLGEEQLNNETLLNDEEFSASNLMNTINGLTYANLHYSAYTGQMIRWYIMNFGSEIDLHTFHWHALVLVDNFGHRVDVSFIQPGDATVLQMFVDDAGDWIFHCHVNSHFHGGMAFFNVTPTDEFYQSRNFATLHDPFSYMFPSNIESTETVPEQVSIWIYDPFSSAVRLGTGLVVMIVFMLL
jgi:hypothetical protein